MNTSSYEFHSFSCRPLGKKETKYNYREISFLDNNARYPVYRGVAKSKCGKFRLVPEKRVAGRTDRFVKVQYRLPTIERIWALVQQGKEEQRAVTRRDKKRWQNPKEWCVIL